MAHPEATFVNGAQHVSRRALLGFGPVALTSCISPQMHFGNTIPPQSQTLIYEISSEPSTFDPARMLGSGESSVMNALLECLVKANPETLEPEAALATHYEVNASATEFVFYLRGHPNPKVHNCRMLLHLPHLLFGAMARGSPPTILLWHGNAASIRRMHAWTQYPST